PIRSPGAIRRLVSESRIRLHARSSRPGAVIMTGVLALWIGRLTGAGKDAGRPVGPVGAGQVSLRNAARRRVYLVAQIDVVRVSGRPAVAQVWGFCLSRAPLLTLGAPIGRPCGTREPEPGRPAQARACIGAPCSKNVGWEVDGDGTGGGYRLPQYRQIGGGHGEVALGAPGGERCQARVGEDRLHGAAVAPGHHRCQFLYVCPTLPGGRVLYTAVVL